MANTGQPSAPVNCVDVVECWISHNAGFDWFEVPNTSRIQKQPTRQNAQQIKLKGVSQNVCSSATKTWTYLVNIWNSKSAPYQNYILDGQTVWMRFVNGDNLASDEQEVVQATFDDDGYTLDDQGTNPASVQLRFEAAQIFRKNYTGVASTPNVSVINEDAAITAAGVSL